MSAISHKQGRWGMYSIYFPHVHLNNFHINHKETKKKKKSLQPLQDCIIFSQSESLFIPWSLVGYLGGGNLLIISGFIPSPDMFVLRGIFLVSVGIFWSSAPAYEHERFWALLGGLALEIALNLSLTSRIHRSEKFQNYMHSKYQLRRKTKSVTF